MWAAQWSWLSLPIPITFILRPKHGELPLEVAPCLFSRVVVVVVFQHLHFFLFFTSSQKTLPVKIFSEGNLKQFSPSPSLLMELKENSQVFFSPPSSPLNHLWSDPLRLLASSLSSCSFSFYPLCLSRSYPSFNVLASSASARNKAYPVSHALFFCSPLSLRHKAPSSLFSCLNAPLYATVWVRCTIGLLMSGSVGQLVTNLFSGQFSNQCPCPMARDWFCHASCLFCLPLRWSVRLSFRP